jgi:hypothetical protein
MIFKDTRLLAAFFYVYMQIGELLSIPNYRGWGGEENYTNVLTVPRGLNKMNGSTHCTAVHVHCVILSFSHMFSCFAMSKSF